MTLTFKTLPLILLSTLFTQACFAEVDPAYLTTKAPYRYVGQTALHETAPEGFQPLMVQHVARHGSRGLSSSDDEDLLYQLWQYAQANEGLTELGQTLGQQLEEMIRVHDELGFGQITALGRQEHIDQATRLIARLDTLFATTTEKKILISHSGRARADQSGEAFVTGLIEARPALASAISPGYASPKTLYFHSAEGSEDYVEYEENDPDLKAVLDDMYAQPHVQETFEAVLLGIFSPKIVDQLKQGELFFKAKADPEETLSSVSDAVEALYGLLTISANLTVEGAFNFEPFFTEDQLRVIAEIDDADSFYGRGPGFEGRDVTYRAADRLFAEMLNQANENPATVLASFRFTHSQVMMPVATWLKLPDAWPGAALDEPFTYENSGWRSATISPMAANLQWEIWADDAGKRLIRMLHNEQERPFPEPCEPVEGYRYFYLLDEINRCLVAIHPSLSAFLALNL